MYSKLPRDFLLKMSKSQMNTKSRDYLNDKEAFLRELKQFNESKSIPFKTPTVNGIDIDLFLFYSLVIQRGGLSKVNQTDAWDSFLRPLRLPHPCINGSTLLRKIYGTYLEKFERAKGPPNRDDDNDMEEDIRGRRGGFPRITYSGAYISASGEQLKTGSRAIAGPSERLALSLLSPMPNEQDFAVNVCTVLAADSSNRLPLSTTPHILDFLLAHAGVYNHSSLRDTIGRSYYEARGMYPDKFWRLRAGGGGAKELADESKFVVHGLEQPDLMVQAMASQNNLRDCLMNEKEYQDVVEKVIEEDVHEDWVTEPSDVDQLFAPELQGGAKCVYTQRVLQIASIVRSLSFHEENIQYLSRNTTLIRFLLLCANCWVGTLRQSGLDTLGNICSELIIKDPATCLISRHVLSTIQSAMVSTDRARVLAALEMLNKLSQNEANEEVLLKSLESKIYGDMCSLLTLRDIMVLVCALECVYAVTSLGERACERAARAHPLAHTLMALLTVEAQSYGPRACILMRVVETVSGSAMAEQPQPPVQQQQQQQQQPQTPVKQQVERPSQPTPTVQPQNPPPQPQPQPQMSNIQQSHLQQRTVQENEQFALAWLRASYAPLPARDASAVDAGSVYRQYVASCAKRGRKQEVPPNHFPRLVRTVFGGTVGPNSVTTSTGETQLMYIGIKAKNPPAKTTQSPGPASPILKAQLTHKTAVVEVKPAVSQAQPQQPTPAHPHLSQALDSTSTNTSLIKHLLAHKVSQPAQVVQVAQRQQNLQRGSSANTVLVQPGQSGMEVDPEALIKCTTIIPGGTTSTVTPSSDEHSVMKEEPAHMQMDEQSQLIKSAQNKMLADLLEKKSNPPVQVVQMNQSQVNAPTIQITETGQIMQVKSENPVIQFNAESGQIVAQTGPYLQIKNEAGQVIQLKNEQGQIIHLKSDQLQGVQIKNEHGQIVHLKSEMKDEVESFVADHSYTGPPSKKKKVNEKRERTPQESVSKTAANLYAALAASALEDEEDLVQQPTMQVHQPTLQVQQPTLQVQQPTLQVQQQPMVQQVTQSPMQLQQPMLQVQPMDVQNILTTQSGQLILQEKSMASQQPQYVHQQQMQIITAPSTSQGGMTYLTQNIPGNMMQKTIIIVQGATSGGPITLTVNNPGGLDEATLNSVIAQATEAITQQQIIQKSGVIQSGQRVIVSQPTLVSAPPLTMLKTAIAQNSPQLTPSQQPIITNQPQPHKAQIINTNQQQIVVTQKQPAGLMNTNQGNQQIIQGGQQIIQGGQQLIQGGQQIIQGGHQIIQGGQQIIQTSQMIQGNQQVIQTGQVIQGGQQVIQSGQVMQGGQQVIQTGQVMQGGQQVIQTGQVMQGGQQVIQTGQVIQGGQQVIQGSQQLLQGNQQIIAVSNNQQIIMNTSMKGNVHRVVQQQQRTQVQYVQAQNEAKTTVIQSTGNSQNLQQKAPAQQQLVRQVVTRQPVMMGSQKIGEKETIVTQPITEIKKVVPQVPPTPKPASTPPLTQPLTQDETPWVCRWKGCGKIFDSAASVFNHAAKAHCPQSANDEAPCLWLDCDKIPRKTFALLNHLNDRHCTVNALRAVFNSRRVVTAEGDANKAMSLAFPPNAALAALNKHATEFINPREMMDENEGPVTKSIRLTAALILRNLVIYSNTGRRQLRSYESQLASIAFSSVEASRTIAQVLYDMNHI